MRRLWLNVHGGFVACWGGERVVKMVLALEYLWATLEKRELTTQFLGFPRAPHALAGKNCSFVSGR